MPRQRRGEGGGRPSSAERLGAAESAAASAPCLSRGRGSAKPARGEPLRAVVGFTLTTDDGRNLGVAPSSAGKAKPRFQAEPRSRWRRPTKRCRVRCQAPRAAHRSSPAAVGRLRRRAARGPIRRQELTAGLAGCMGRQASKARPTLIQQIEDQMHKDFKGPRRRASGPTST